MSRSAEGWRTSPPSQIPDTPLPGKQAPHADSGDG